MNERTRLSRGALASGVLLAALVGSGGPARAFVEVTGEATPDTAAGTAPEAPEVGAVDRRGGTEHPEARMAVAHPEPLSLAASRVHVEVRDQVAVVRVRHVIQSNVPRVLQARYVLPLGAGAHVSAYAIWENGEKLVGELMDVYEAERLYIEVTGQRLTPREQEADGAAAEVRPVRVVRDPGILREIGDGAFDTHVYPILPFALREIEVRYAGLVDARGGECVWRFPMGAASIFENPVGEVLFEVTIADSAGVGAVSASAPGADVRRADDGSMRIVHRARSVRFAPGDAFEIRWRTGLAPREVATIAHRADDADTGAALVRVALPEPAMTPASAPLDIVLAIDASASFAPGKSDRRRAILGRLLDALRPGDRLAWLRFAGSVERRTELAPFDASVDRAARAAADGPGSGRTRLAPALASALAAAGAHEEGRRRLVVLATDGVTEEDPEDVLDAVAPTGARLLVIGTGHDDDVGLLGALADRHGGSLWIPGEGERHELWARRPDGILTGRYGTAGPVGATADIEAALSAFRLPAVTGLALEAEDGVLRDVHAISSRDASTAVFVTRYRSAGQVAGRVRGFVDGRPFDREVSLDLPEREPRHGFVDSFWARARVHHLLRLHPTNDRDPCRGEIVALSLAGRFVTPFTAFLSLPDMERRRLLLGPAPADDADELYRFQFVGATPEAETWVLILVGALFFAGLELARRRRAPATSVTGRATA